MTYSPALLGFATDLGNLVAQTGPVAKLVLIILLLFSILSWSIILSKWSKFRRMRTQSGRFLRAFRKANGRLQDVSSVSEQFKPSPLAAVFEGGYDEYRRQAGSRNITAVQRATQIASSEEMTQMESRLPWLLTALARRHSTARAADDTVPGADRVARVVRDRLADELLAPPSLADLAAELDLSRYQLLRAFRTTMGMPPYAWLAQYRVARARGLLEAGRRPAEVAALVGFADQAHLTRWFRRVLGVTPAAYRNSVQDAAR